MVLRDFDRMMQKMKEGEERAGKLYAAIEDLIPVFEEWKKIQQVQTEKLDQLNQSIDRLTVVLEKQG